MNPFTQVVIAACIDGGTLTIAVRVDEEIAPPTQHQITDAASAARVLLDLKTQHRHDDPQIFLAHSAIAPRVMERIVEAHKGERLLPCRDEVVDGTQDAQVTARFSNRWSELVHSLREQIELNEVTLPPECVAEIAAIKPGMRDGRVFYPYAEDVAEELGRLPVNAIVAVLAAQPAPFRRGTKPAPDHDLYSDSSLGYDPYEEIA